MLPPQIYKGDPRTCAIFILAWGSNWRSLDFSRNQNNHGSSGACVTCIYCGLRVKINMCKTPHGMRRLCFAFVFACMVRQKPEDQWRNSYGLRVGKPTGTRAKGAPPGCPFILVFQLKLPFQKGAPFQNFFHSFSLVARFS